MRIGSALGKLAVGTALLTLFGAATATPALAGKPLDRGTFHDVDTHSSAEDPEWPCTLGYDVTIALDIHGSFHYGPRKPGGPNYGLETSHGWVSYSANGSTYKDVFSFTNKDYAVTQNQDGSLTVLVMGTGVDKWYLNGTLLYFDSGQIRLELLITNPGQPNEQVTVVRIVKDSTGRNDGPTGEFCSDLARFLAPTT